MMKSFIQEGYEEKKTEETEVVKFANQTSVEKDDTGESFL